MATIRSLRLPRTSFGSLARQTGSHPITPLIAVVRVGCRSFTRPARQPAAALAAAEAEAAAAGGGLITVPITTTPAVAAAER